MKNQFTFSLPKLVAGILVLLVFICRGSSAASASTIEFTQIPPVNPGGPLTTGSIAGRVNGPHEDLKLVLYARSGRWYVQPYADQPFTIIQPDSSWTSATHLGTEYAALLVQPGYVPSPILDTLPGASGGVIAVAVTEGTPPFWHRWWFRLLVVVLLLLLILAFYHWRMRELARQLNLRFEERLAERIRIAHELHDTLLQGFLSASMQMHILNDQLPEGSPQKQLSSHILSLMGQVITEGRNAVQGLRPASVSPHDLEDALSRLPQELPAADQTDFRLVVEGAARSLHPIIRDAVYRIGREAVTNAFRHAEANTIQVELEYGNRELRIVVRDNGRGIEQQVLSTGREGHWGIPGMRERAEEIGARLKLWSRKGAGTEIELSIPGQVAYEFQPPRSGKKWLTKLYARKSNHNGKE